MMRWGKPPPKLNLERILTINQGGLFVIQLIATPLYGAFFIYRQHTSCGLLWITAGNKVTKVVYTNT